jgi:hypothetical protein
MWCMVRLYWASESVPRSWRGHERLHQEHPHATSVFEELELVGAADQPRLDLLGGHQQGQGEAVCLALLLLGAAIGMRV